ELVGEGALALGLGHPGRGGGGRRGLGDGAAEDGPGVGDEEGVGGIERVEALGIGGVGEAGAEARGGGSTGGRRVHAGGGLGDKQVGGGGGSGVAFSGRLAAGRAVVGEGDARQDHHGSEIFLSGRQQRHGGPHLGVGAFPLAAVPRVYQARSREKVAGRVVADGVPVTV